LEELRLQLEKQKIAECTFTPAIIKNHPDMVKRSSESNTRDSSADPWHRLASTPAKDVKKLEAIQQELLQREKEECTFTPNKNRPPSPLLQSHTLDKSSMPRLSMPKTSDDTITVVLL